MIPKFRIFDKKKKRFLDDFAMEIDRDGINVLDEFNYVVDEDDRVLMQATGLTDKNGKEIFEGDIVKNSYREIGYIKHSIYTFVFAKKKECEWREFYLHGIGAGSPFEIIGNIHENPELLENI